MKLANPKTGSRLPKGLNTEDQRPCGAMALVGPSALAGALSSMFAERSGNKYR
jgi:hypothetical protein